MTQKLSNSDIIKNPDSFTTVLMKAMKNELGDFILWEPESIWLEAHNRSLDIPEINKNKIMAALALELVPAFYWDARVYEATALCLNNVIPHTDILNEVSPDHLAWAVTEVSKLPISGNSMVLDSEPVAYTAVVLHRAGFVLAPKELAFCQEALDRINRDTTLKTDTQKTWEEIQETDLKERKFDETPKDAQLAKLAAVTLYMREQHKKYNEQLASL